MPKPLIAPDIPFENRRRIDVARAVVKEATLTIIDAQRGAASFSTSLAVAAANSSSSMSSAGAAAGASAAPSVGPPSLRRSSRGTQTSAAAIQWAIDNPLRPKYHDVDLEQLDEAARAFKRFIGTTLMDKMPPKATLNALVPADAPYNYVRTNEIALAVVREATFELRGAQRRSATTPSAAATSSTTTTSAASTSTATTSSTTTAASSTPTQEAFSPPPRRSTRSKSAGTSSNARPAIRQTQSDPAQPDSRIPLQIINDVPRGAAEKHRNKDLQPTYHSVNSDPLDEAARALKKSLSSSTSFQRLRVQVAPSYCLEPDLPQESLSLGAIQRTTRNPPSVDLKRFRRTTRYDEDWPSAQIVQVRLDAEDPTLAIFAVKLIADGYKQRVDQGEAFNLKAFLREHAPSQARLPLLRRLAIHQGRNDVNQV